MSYSSHKAGGCMVFTNAVYVEPPLYLPAS